MPTPPTDPRQTLDVRPAQPPAVDHPAPVSLPAFAPPAQLPADILDFTGRITETRQLTNLLAAGDGVPLRTAVPVVVVTGPSGVGKSTIVRHIGHLLQSPFPDGQLDVALRGGQERPADPSDMLEQVLVALGVNPAVIPGDPEARAQLYRSVTAGRRLLVVLDDAASAAQVRPLLPGGASLAHSFRGLDPDTARAGRILALPDPPVFSAADAAATLRIPLAVAEQQLDRLVIRRDTVAVSWPSTDNVRWSRDGAQARAAGVGVGPAPRGGR